VLLNAQYADTERRRRAWALQRRLAPSGRHAAPTIPDPAPLAPGLYSTRGLSTLQISLLTGHTASNVHDVLPAPILSWASSRSPWCERTFM
jgi:hypothetical protein